MSTTNASRGASDKFHTSEIFIREAVEQANLNALRMALYQQTGDPRLENIGIEEQGLRGGALIVYQVAEKDRQTIKEIAVDLLSREVPREISPPSKTEARRLMEMFIGRTISDAEFRYGFEELAFEEYPRNATWNTKPPASKLDKFEVAIIGAGLSGLATGVQLNRLGIKYKIFDRQSGIGGTWHLNDYPQSRVDISTFLYQFKFDKNYPWKSHFATRNELKEYAEYIAQKYEVAPHIQLNTSLTAAKWDEAAKKWKLEFVGPKGPFELDANVVVSCAGLFSTPNLPDIDGINSFKGKMFHTTAWDHSFDYAGKSVALIGTGSTGCQLTPGVAEVAAHMTVYQRTPSWITPVKGYRAEVTDEKRWLFDTLPGYWNWFVYSAYVAEVEMQGLQVVDQRWVENGGGVNERNANFRKALTEYIYSKFPGDPTTAEKCVPNYPPLARRLVIDNGWYDALARDNVELVTDGIERITEKGIRSKDGVEREFDLIILSAGFQVSKYLWPAEYEGRNGSTPDKLWQRDGARAYLGLTLPDHPNFFICYGPNGQARAGGFHDWAEIWARYIGELLVHMIENDHQSFCVHRDRFEQYNAAMDEENKKLLWETEGVGGYYVNKHGRSGVNMPWTMHEFFEMVRSAKPEDFEWL